MRQRLAQILAQTREDGQDGDEAHDQRQNAGISHTSTFE